MPIIDPQKFAETIGKIQIQDAILLIKPETILMRQIHTVIRFWEEKGFEILAYRTIFMDENLMEQFYPRYVGQSFWPNMLSSFSKTNTVAIWARGPYVRIQVMRLHGYFSADTPPGTLRAEISTGLNMGTMVHCSDNQKNFEREWKIIFG